MCVFVKNLLLISALTFLLIMCSHNAFSDEVLDSIFVGNHNISNAKNSFSGINNKVEAKGGHIKIAGNMVSYGWYSGGGSKNSGRTIKSKRFNVDIEEEMLIILVLNMMVC